MNGQEALAVIDKVAATSSRTEKELILSAAVDGNEFFQRVVRLAYDPFITFGVTWPNAALAAAP